MNSIYIKRMGVDDIPPDFLENFRRHQPVNRAWRRDGDEYVLCDVSYTSDWNIEKKASVARGLVETIEGGGAVFAAFEGERLMGFASVLGEPIGARGQYLDLHMLHVSEEYRGRGVGRALFESACAYARERGAEKLYLSAHSAESPMAFYYKVGCMPAAEPNAAHVEEEPYDVQLEYILK